MGFWPYFLQENSSGGISAIFMLIAGTLITLFTFDFLFTKIKPKNDIRIGTHKEKRHKKLIVNKPFLGTVAASG